MSAPASPPKRHLRPIYSLSADGTFATYSGDLLILGGGQGDEQRVPGVLELRLEPKVEFSAKVIVDRKTAFHMIGLEKFPVVRLPAGVALEPPTGTSPSTNGTSSGEELYSIHINQMITGDVASVRRLIFHISGSLTDFPFPACVTDEGEQDQLEFSLPGWELRMAAVNDSGPARNFAFVVEATPEKQPITSEAIDLLEERIFILLGIVAGAEIGPGPVVGLDEFSRIVWAHWGAPKVGRPVWQWCPEAVVNSALPSLAKGFSSIADDPVLEKVLGRAVKYWMAANAPGVVLDVKIPVACSGLELLAWGVLQQHQWLTPDSFNKLNSGQSLRLLLQFAGIPIELPRDFDALKARKAGFNQSTDAGPDLIFNVRNELIHPPKKIAKLEWPTSEELHEAWRLAMWYLELVILRLLEYKGGYHSRLRYGWQSVDPVPWAT